MADDVATLTPVFGGARRPFVYRHVVSLQETNLVGNVYFATLAAWQGRCREMFLRAHAPEILADLSGALKLVTTHLRIDFVLELFAFEEVQILMRLISVSGHKIRMDFEYVVERNGETFVAAQGEQEVACLVQGHLAPPPPSLAAALRMFGAGGG
jgi:enediyne biosynthesis thioesterase